MSGCVKIDSTLYSSASDIIEVLFNNKDCRNLYNEFYDDCFEIMMKDLMMNLDLNGYKSIWNYIFNFKWKNEQKFLSTMELYFNYANNKKLENCDTTIIKKVIKMIKSSKSQQLIEIAKLIIKKLPTSQNIHHIIVTVLESDKFVIQDKFNLIQFGIDFPTLHLILRTYMCQTLVDINQSQLQDNDGVYFKQTVQCMLDLVLKQFPIETEIDWHAEITSADDINNQLFELSQNYMCDFLKEIMRLLETKNLSDELLWSICTLIPHIYPFSCSPDIAQVLSKKINDYCDNMSLLFTILNTFHIVNTQCKRPVKLSVNFENYWTQLSEIPKNHYKESILLSCLNHFLANSSITELDVERKINLVLPRLMASNHKTRYYALKVLLQLNHIEPSIVHFLNEFAIPLEGLLECDRAKFLIRERTMASLIINYRNKYLVNNEQPQLLDRIKLFHMIGMMTISFEPFTKLILQNIRTYDNFVQLENIIWESIEPILSTDGVDELPEPQFDCCEYISDYTKMFFWLNSEKVKESFHISLMIRLLMHLLQLAGRKTVVLTALFMEQYNMMTNRIKSDRTINMIPLIDLFAKLPNKTGIYNESIIRENMLSLLAGSESRLQFASLKYILAAINSADLNKYKDNLLNFFGDKENVKISELMRIPLSEICMSVRHVFLPIIFRMCIGFLKNKKMLRNRIAILNYFYGIQSYEEMTLLIEIIFGDFRKHDGESVVSGTVELIRNKIEEFGDDYNGIELLFRKLQDSLNIMDLLLHRCITKLNEDHLKDFYSGLVTIYETCSTYKSRLNEELMEVEEEELDRMDTVEEVDDECNEEDEDNEEEDEGNEEGDDNEEDEDKDDEMEVNEDEEEDKDEIKKKSTKHRIIKVTNVLRQNGGKMIEFYFNKLGNFTWSPKLIGETIEQIIKPQLLTLEADNVSDARLIIRLLHLWSQSDNLCYLINLEMMQKMVNLLSHPKLNFLKVGNKLVAVIYAILQYWITQKELLHLELQDQRIINDLLEPIMKCIVPNLEKLKVMRFNKPNIVVKMQMQLFILAGECYLSYTNENINDNDNFLALGSKLTQFLFSSNKIKNRKTMEDNGCQENEINCLKMIEIVFQVTSICDDYTKLLARLINLFSRLEHRGSRVVLSHVVSVGWKRMTANNQLGISWDLESLATRMNKWCDKHLDVMDYTVIEECIDEIMNALKSPDRNINTLLQQSILDESSKNEIHPCFWGYLMVAQNCIYILSKTQETGLHLAAQTMLEMFIGELSKCNDKDFIFNIFTDKLWPGLWHALTLRIDCHRAPIISLVQCVIRNLRSLVPRFNELITLVNDDDLSILDKFNNTTPAIQSQALRSISRWLKRSETRLSKTNIEEIVMPLIMIRITEADETIDKLNTDKLDTIAASYEALSSLCRHMSVKFYKNMITQNLAKLGTNTKNVETIKIIISLLDGYHLEITDNNVKFTNDILKNLQHHLPKKDKSHKNKKEVDNGVEPEKSDLPLSGVTLQSTLAYAIVNVSQKLPVKSMKMTVNSMLMRVSEFLRSDDESVRKEAGVCLSKILEKTRDFTHKNEKWSVKFLSFLVKHLRSIMNRGRQRFIGLNTIGKILTKLQKTNANEVKLDNGCVKALAGWYIDDLFGEMAKERMERKAADKGIIPEGKNGKGGIVGLQIVAEMADGPVAMMEMMNLICETAAELSDTDSLRRMEAVLDSISGKRSGLIANKDMEIEAMFTVGVGLVIDHDLFSSKKKAISNDNEMDCKQSESENYLLYKPAVRLDGFGLDLDIDKREQYVTLLITCGLRILCNLCKREAANTSVNIASMLKPVVDPIYVMLKGEGLQNRKTGIAGLQLLVQIVQTGLANPYDILDLMILFHEKLVGPRIVTNQDDIQRIKLVYNVISQLLNFTNVELTKSQSAILHTGLELHLATTNDSISTENISRAGACLILVQALLNHKSRDIEILSGIIINSITIVAVDSVGERICSQARSILCQFLSTYDNNGVENASKIIIQRLCEIVEPNILNEKRVFTFLLIRDLFNVFKERLANNNIIRECFMTCIVCVLSQDNINETVQAALGFVVENYLSFLDLDDRAQECNWAFEYISDNDNMDKCVGCYSWLISNSMVNNIEIEAASSVWRRLSNIIFTRIFSIIDDISDYEAKLGAAHGADSDLMMELDVGQNEDIGGNIQKLIYNGKSMLESIGLAFEKNNENSNVICVEILKMSKVLWENTTVMNKIIGSKYSTLRCHFISHFIVPCLEFVMKYETNQDCIVNCDTVILRCMGQLIDLDDNIEKSEADLIVVCSIVGWRYLTKFKNGNVDDISSLLRIITLANKVVIHDMEGRAGLQRRLSIMIFLNEILKMNIGTDNYKIKDLWDNAIWMWQREFRRIELRVGNKNERNSEIHTLLPMIKQSLESIIGKDKFLAKCQGYDKQRISNKRKHEADECALAVSDPAAPLKKKMRRAHAKKENKINKRIKKF